MTYRLLTTYLINGISAFHNFDRCNLYFKISFSKKVMNELLCAYLFACVCVCERKSWYACTCCEYFYAWTDPEGYMNLICDMFDIIISFFLFWESSTFSNCCCCLSWTNCSCKLIAYKVDYYTCIHFFLHTVQFTSFTVSFFFCLCIFHALKTCSSANIFKHLG